MNKELAGMMIVALGTIALVAQAKPLQNLVGLGA
jgi:hypothetical protein